MSDQMVAVAAVNCPYPTTAIFRQAAREADALGLGLGAYLGRHDEILSPLASPGTCCHVFGTTDLPDYEDE